MKDLADFSVQDRRGFFRPRRFRNIAHAAEVVDSALAFARLQGIPEVVADVTALAAYPAPSIAERFWIVNRWAETAAGSVRLAVVARPEHIDPERFGVTVARNRGLEGNIFTTEADAVAWLDGLPNA